MLHPRLQVALRELALDVVAERHAQRRWEAVRPPLVRIRLWDMQPYTPPHLSRPGEASSHLAQLGQMVLRCQRVLRVR